MDVTNSFNELNQKLIRYLGIQNGESDQVRDVFYSGRTFNTWKFPKLRQDVWAIGDSKTIRDFYIKHVKIEGEEWQTNCECIDFLLEYLFKNINDQVKKDYPCLQLQRFVRQGSSRDGLKVGAADEFDAVLPIKFVGCYTEVIDYPKNNLPPGIAEVKVTSLNKKTDDILKSTELIVERSDGEYINTKSLHEKLFKSIIDKVLDKYKKEAVAALAQRRSIVFDIRRRSHSPAFILCLDVPEKGLSISVDIVPGYLINGSTDNMKKFLVTRWIPEQQNETLAIRFPCPLTSWRISLSHFEMKVFEDFQESGDTSAHRLIAACRILKVLRNFSRGPYCSQFKSVLKSYHIKNILLYSLLFLKVKGITFHSVTSALGNLIAVTRMALAEKNLPQFFTDRLALETFFPNEIPYETTDNLLAERKEASLDIACSDMHYMLWHSGLEDAWDLECQDIKRFFKKRIEYSKGLSNLPEEDESFGDQGLAYAVAGLKIAEEGQRASVDGVDRPFAGAWDENSSEGFQTSGSKAKDNLKLAGKVAVCGLAVVGGLVMLSKLLDREPPRRNKAEEDDG